MLSPSAIQWLSLIGMIWLQSTNGTNYDFAAYSSQLKNLLSLNQFQLNNLAFASDAGKLFGWLSGIAANCLPIRLVLVIGAALGLVGYGVQFLILVDKITSLPYWVIFLVNVLAGNSICWINTVCFVMTVRNFPSYRQIAGGLSTSYIGLSGKIYTLLVASFLNGSPTKRAKSFLLMNSIVPMIVSFLSAPLLIEIKDGSPHRLERGFLVFFIITVITGIYAISGSIIRSISSWYLPNLHILGLIVLLAVPLAIPLATMLRESLGKKKVHVSMINDISVVEKGETEVKEEGVGQENVGSGRKEVETKEMVVVDQRETDVKEEGVGKENGGVGRKEVGTKEMVKRLEFWLYYFVYMSGKTVGLVYLHNLGQIAESRGNTKTASLVSVSSSFGFFGRLIPPLLDYIMARYKVVITRPAFIASFMPPMAAAFFLLLNTSMVSLYISTAVIGACTGAIASLAVSTTIELFGTKYLSINHNIIVTNIPLGSFIYGNAAAFLYQRAADGGDGRCMGSKCYSLTFLVGGLISSTGALLSFLLYYRNSRFSMRKQPTELTKN